MTGYTETQAKGKWCPFARLGNATGCNRSPRKEDMTPSATARCIASECMAWRWTQHGPGCTQEFGHCGLAGRM